MDNTQVNEQKAEYRETEKETFKVVLGGYILTCQVGFVRQQCSNGLSIPKK